MFVQRTGHNDGGAQAWQGRSPIFEGVRTERERAVLIVNDFFGAASYCLFAGAWYLFAFIELRAWSRKGVKK